MPATSWRLRPRSLTCLAEQTAPGAGADVDVLIVGAGPAGASAALAARRADPTARVALWDRARFPRDKVCGDGLAPHAVEVLSCLGVDGVTDGFPPVSRLSVQGVGGAVATRSLPRPDYVIPRRVLDARILAAARQAGAAFEQRTVRRVQVEPDGVVVDGVRTRVLIGSDGALSRVARSLGLIPQTGRDLAIAIRGYAPAPAGTPVQRIVFVAADRPSYAWSFPVGDGTVNVGYGARRDRFRGTRDTLVDRLEQALGPTGVADLAGHPLPLSTGARPWTVGPVLLAGDAAGLINPLSGEGLYYAVASGALAGAAAVGSQPAVTYRRDLTRLLARHVRHTRLLARLVEFPAVAEAGITAAAARQRVFDDLVELAIGRGTLTAPLAAATAGRLATGRR